MSSDEEISKLFPAGAFTKGGAAAAEEKEESAAASPLVEASEEEEGPADKEKAPVESKPEGEEEVEDSPLLAKDEDGEEEDGASADGKASKSGRTLKDRLHQVIGERNTFKEQITTMGRELETRNTRLRELDPLLEAIESAYGGGKFENPVAQIEADAAFVTAIDALFQKGDPVVKQAVAKIHEFQKTGRTTVSETKSDNLFRRSADLKFDDKKDDETPAADPRLDKILRRDAERSTRQVLREVGKVRDAWVGPISRFILDSTKDLEGLDEGAIIAGARRYLKAEGLSANEVLAPAKADAKGAKRKPPTGSGRAAVSDKDGGDTKQADDDSTGRPAGHKTPKTLDELRANRQQRLASVVREVTQTA